MNRGRICGLRGTAAPDLRPLAQILQGQSHMLRSERRSRTDRNGTKKEGATYGRSGTDRDRGGG